MTVFKARLIVVVAALGLAFALLVARLFEIQVVSGKLYAAQSRKQTKQRAVILARRGAIFDRGGRALAETIDAQGEQLVSAGTVLSAGTRSGIRRLYPQGKVAASVLGYVGIDGYGLGGIEYTFDQELRGQNGWRIMQKDGINNRYARIDMPKRPPANGADVYLTIDLRIQKIVEHVLSRTVEQLGAKGGCCVVMDPVNGDILAMANEPTFDPNHAGDFGLDRRTNDCISYNYEPGSTFKIIAAASALEEGIKNAGDTIDGNQGVYEVYGQSIRDHKPFGRLSFTQAMSYSSNVCFAKIADELGNERLYRYAKDFGLGAQTGIDLPGEEQGIVHPVDRWSGRTRVTMAIGQEVSVTLLQMVLAFAAVANDGVLIEPRISTRIVDAEGRSRTSDGPRTVRRVIRRDTARRLREMLRSVVDTGTGRQAAISGVSVAGKTGTSQKIDKETGEYSSDRVWASFIGFAPADEPVLVCGVVIDEPASGEVGGVAAAPAFRNIMSQIISHPELEFAEKILGPVEPGNLPRNGAAKRLPDVCAMERATAAGLLRHEGIHFEIIGTGNVIRHQSPAAGETFAAGARMILYAHDEDGRIGVRMPDCVGKDLRDAINAVNIKGLYPHVMGSGLVKDQYPTAGVILKTMDVCTLYCLLDG